MAKLNLGVDEAGTIVAQALTTSNADDAVTGTKLIDKVRSKIKTAYGPRIRPHCNSRTYDPHPSSP